MIFRTRDYSGMLRVGMTRPNCFCRSSRAPLKLLPGSSIYRGGPGTAHSVQHSATCAWLAHKRASSATPHSTGPRASATSPSFISRARGCWDGAQPGLDSP